MKFFFEDSKNPSIWLTYDVISTKVKIRKVSIVKIKVQQYKASRQLPARRNDVRYVAHLKKNLVPWYHMVNTLSSIYCGWEYKVHCGLFINIS